MTRRRAGGAPLLARMLAAGAVFSVIVGGGFFVLLRATQDLRSASTRRGNSDREIALANKTEKLVLDLETGTRGYVLTRREKFLEPWRAAVEAFPAAAAGLVDAGESPREHRLARAIQQEGLSYIENWTRPVIAAARRNPRYARSLIATEDGKQRVDSLRAKFNKLIGPETRQSAARARGAEAAAHRAIRLAIVGLVGSVLLSVLYALYLARAVSVPVRRVAGAADRLADGDLRTRVPTSAPGELARLGSSFNAMAGSLEASRAALDAARDEAERANHAKSEFLSRMSHELRTPLNAVIGFGQLLELDELTEDQAESVSHIMRGGRHLLSLINEVLDISRIESGTLSMSLEPVPIGDALADALSLLRPAAEARDVRLIRELGDHAERHVMADHQRLKQVLLNVLSNAVKYNRQGGAVTVALEDAGDWLHVHITDQGRGIPADRLDRLFVPFDRLGAEAGEVEGTGLGLALSERLVGAMGGQIRAESTVGLGSTFTIALKSADAPTQRAGSDPLLRAIRDAPPVGAGTVLYIEDNASNLRVVERVLAPHTDVRLITAMRATLGLELAHEHRPDLILLDLHLPDMSGAAALELLQADPATEHVPVVVLSADATDSQLARLRASGVYDYLTKPLDIPRFLEVVRAVLAAGAGVR